MTTSELVQLGTDLVNQAEAKNIALRMIGGVAIYARCPGIESNPRLQHANSDLDFMVTADALPRAQELITAQGFRPNENSNAALRFTRDHLTIELSPPQYHKDFNIDFSSRLTLTPLTLPLVDLLLMKLARVEFRTQDIQDVAALLVDHRVSDEGDEAEDIVRERLYHVANNEYRLWKTIFDNTVTLEKIFDKYLEPEEAQLAWRRTERLQEVLDGKSHSFGWWTGRLVTR